MIVTVDDTLAPCAWGCGQHTRVRLDGSPGHYGCRTRTETTTPPCEPSPPPASPPVDETRQLRFLTDLEKIHVPRRRVDGRMRPPYWRPQLPDIIDLVHVVSSWSWYRTGFTGRVAVLDRSGAWIAAASSVDVAHGTLDHAGEGRYRGNPGLYLVDWHPWTETGMPHPLGRQPRRDDETAWITAPRAKLLKDLADAGRWPSDGYLDSYVGDPVRLREWAAHVQAHRIDAIRRHGRDSDQYDAVKVAFSQAVSLMQGTRDPGHARTWKAGCQRTDWALHIEDQAATTLWRIADECRRLAPGLGPVAMRNVDELLVPVDALATLTEAQPPATRPAVRLDPRGIDLGTFKIKGYEPWER